MKQVANENNEGSFSILLSLEPICDQTPLYKKNYLQFHLVGLVYKFVCKFLHPKHVSVQ
jgi:hypothetical protein